MLIKTIHSWQIPEHRVTPEQVFLNRRKFIAAAGFAGIGLAAGIRPGHAEADPSAGLYPVETNPMYKDAGRPITPEDINTTYNNFYEFGTSKRISQAAQALKIRPWEIAFEGEVEKPFKLGFDEMLKKVQLEERVYRHRCVEAWSMTVPWSGFTVKQLVELAKPTSNAKFVKFETFYNPDIAPGQKPPLFGAGLSVAVRGRPDHGRGDERPGVHGDRCLWQAGGEVDGRADPAARAVEVWLQVDQVDQQGDVHGRAAKELLGDAWPERVRVLGQREPAGGPSALEPGGRARAGDRREDPDGDLERIWRAGGVAICRHGKHGRQALPLTQRSIYQLAVGN
jgi:hypothetical protein